MAQSKARLAVGRNDNAEVSDNRREAAMRIPTIAMLVGARLCREFGQIACRASYCINCPTTLQMSYLHQIRMDMWPNPRD